MADVRFPTAGGPAPEDGLEGLTSPGSPFLDPSRLVPWLSSVERQVCQIRCLDERGTGFLVAPDLVLTCYHVVRPLLEGAATPSAVQVRFDYREPAEGEPPAGDAPWLDLDPAWQIPRAPMGQPDATRRTSWTSPF